MFVRMLSQPNWTHGQTDRQTSGNRSNVGLAHARPQLQIDQNYPIIITACRIRVLLERKVPLLLFRILPVHVSAEIGDFHHPWHTSNTCAYAHLQNYPQKQPNVYM